MILRIYLLYLSAYLTIASAWSPSSRADFQSAIQRKALTLVAFVEPSTEASKALEPEWLAAVSQTKVPLMSVDCAKEVDLCKEQDIISYPAIRLFQNGGNLVRYRGPRKASDIVAFLKRSELPKLSTLNQKNITAFQSVDANVFVAYLTPDHSKFLPNLATMAAHNSDRFTFGITSDAGTAKLMKISSPSLMHYHSDSDTEALPLPATNHDIEEFIEKATAPLVSEMTRRNELKYIKSGKSFVYILSTSEKERAEFQQSLKPLAKKYKEYLSFVTIDAMEYEAMAKAMGVNVGKLASLVVQNPLLGQIFLYPENQRRTITSDVVERFVLDIVQGNVQPSSSGGNSGPPSHQEL